MLIYCPIDLKQQLKMQRRENEPQMSHKTYFMANEGAAAAAVVAASLWVVIVRAGCVY